MTSSPGADAEGAQGDGEAVGAVGDADGAGRAHVGGGLLLEALDVRPEDDAPAAQHVEHGRLDAVLQLGVLPLDVHESDGHAMRLLAAVRSRARNLPQRSAAAGHRSARAPPVARVRRGRRARPLTRAVR